MSHATRVDAPGEGSYLRETGGGDIGLHPSPFVAGEAGEAGERPASYTPEYRQPGQSPQMVRDESGAEMPATGPEMTFSESGKRVQGILDSSNAATFGGSGGGTSGLGGGQRMRSQQQQYTQTGSQKGVTAGASAKSTGAGTSAKSTGGSEGEHQHLAHGTHRDQQHTEQQEQQSQSYQAGGTSSGARLRESAQPVLYNLREAASQAVENVDGTLEELQPLPGLALEHVSDVLLGCAELTISGLSALLDKLQPYFSGNAMQAPRDLLARARALSESSAQQLQPMLHNVMQSTQHVVADASGKLQRVHIPGAAYLASMAGGAESQTHGQQGQGQGQGHGQQQRGQGEVTVSREEAHRLVPLYRTPEEVAAEERAGITAKVTSLLGLRSGSSQQEQQEATGGAATSGSGGSSHAGEWHDLQQHTTTTTTRTEHQAEASPGTEAL